MLCYDRDVLPQGAPTSPWIANLVLRPFDEKLGAWCRARGVVYTRYCDDLAFSGTALDGVEERAEEGLRALGFRLNGAKRALCRDGQQKRVTGLVVNERVAVPACRRRRLRQELYFCRSRGVEEHLRAAGLAEGRSSACGACWGRWTFGSRPSRTARRRRSIAVGCWPRCGINGEGRGETMKNRFVRLLRMGLPGLGIGSFGRLRRARGAGGDLCSRDASVYRGRGGAGPAGGRGAVHRGAPSRGGGLAGGEPAGGVRNRELRAGG